MSAVNSTDKSEKRKVKRIGRNLRCSANFRIFSYFFTKETEMIGFEI